MLVFDKNITVCYTNGKLIDYKVGVDDGDTLGTDDGTKLGDTI